MENEIKQTELTRAEKRARKKEARKQARQQDKQSKVTQIAGAVIVVIALIIGWQAVTKNSDTANAVTTPPPGEISEHDRLKGNPDAQVIITEYSDFQCPACAGYYPILKQAASEYGDRIAFVYRHFPLFSIHPNAEEAAWASEAAGQQGKFWEMHDLLFDRQSQWSNERGIDDVFKDYAEFLELNVEQWEADYDSDFVRDKVDADVASANKERVNATPTFYINGSRMTSNVRNIDDLRRIIDAELGIVGQAPDSANTLTTEDVSIEVEGEASGIQVENIIE